MEEENSGKKSLDMLPIGSFDDTLNGRAGYSIDFTQCSTSKTFIERNIYLTNFQNFCFG